MHKRGDYFGERALLADEPRTATVTVTSSTVRVLALDHESFSLLLGPLAELMHEFKENKHTRRVKRRASSAASHLGRGTVVMQTKKFNSVVDYEDLAKVGLLGNGGFGCVELFQHTKTGDTY